MPGHIGDDREELKAAHCRSRRRGGIVGVLRGLGIGYGITNLLGVPMMVNPSIIAVAVAFSLGRGAFFGYYPARTAAALDPIEALPYE